jgi:hypothetical protein
MRHFYRCHLSPADVLVAADRHFAEIGMSQLTTAPRSRTYAGPLGALKLSARPEGGHYTFVEVNTDQMGESRLDRNVKRFFVSLHRTEDPTHVPQASY